MPEKKRKQHYVWQHYLKAWTTNDRLWCLHEGRPFTGTTRNVAHEIDFYRLLEMTDADLTFVEKVIVEPLSAHLQEMARGWIAPFVEVFDLRRAHRAGGLFDAAYERQLDVAINNIEEDLHAKIESAAVPRLDDLRHERVAFLSDEEQSSYFMWFLGAQYMRTPSIKRHVLDAFPQGTGVNLEASWGLIRTILAANLGLGLHGARDRLRTVFLHAPQAAELVTGDQPIVNTRGNDSGEVTSELELYYPLGPRLAVLFAFDAPAANVDRRDLSVAEVAGYNSLISQASLKQVYAASEQALLALPPRSTTP